MSNEPTPENQPEEGHEDYQEEFIHEGEILEELALDDHHEDLESQSDEEMQTDEQVAQQAEVENQEIPDDSVQGFYEHKEPVYCVTLHPLLPIAATGGGDDQSMMWNYQSGELIAVLAKHSDTVSCVAFSNDGNYIASGGLDGKVYIFDMQGSTICGLDGPSEVSWLRWHPRGSIVVAGSEDGTIWMWNAQTGQCMNVFTGHSESVSCAQFTPNGKLLVSSSIDQSITVWDPKSAQSLTKWNSSDARFHQAPITSFAIKDDNKTIVSGAQDGTVLLLQIGSNKILNSLDNHEDSIESISFSPTNSYVAVGSVAGTIDVIDTTTYRTRFRVLHHVSFLNKEAVTKVCWAKRQSRLISSSLDGFINIWDGLTGELIKSFSGHQKAVLDVCVSDDDTVVVSASDDGASLVFQL